MKINKETKALVELLLIDKVYCNNFFGVEIFPLSILRTMLSFNNAILAMSASLHGAFGVHSIEVRAVWVDKLDSFIKLIVKDLGIQNAICRDGINNHSNFKRE